MRFVSADGKVTHKNNLDLGPEYPIRPEFEKWTKSDNVKTLPELIRRAVDSHGECNFLGSRVGSEYVFRTFNDIYQDALFFASALLGIGWEIGGRVASFSGNCMQWPVVDFGTTHVGGVHVPMYATLSQNELAHIVKDCGAKFIFVLTKEQLQKVLAVESQLPELKYIITPASIDGLTSTKQLWSWQDFMRYGRVHLKQHQARIEEIVSSLEPSDIASIIYTSGTTGDPKGVMLMHGNFCSQLADLNTMVHMSKDDIHLSFLPVAHVFERIFWYLSIYSGASVGMAQSLMTVLQDMQVLRPTTFTSVPALYSKIYERAVANMTGFKGKPMNWTLKAGRSYNANKRLSRVDKAGRVMYNIMRKMLFSDLLKKVGGRIRMLISGGAPLPANVCEFFLNLGFVLREGYGLTETSPVICLNDENDIRPASIGIAIPGVSVKIAEDGELLAKGPNIMRGYYKRPEATREVFDEEGWFHTGDVAYMEDRNVYITDRKKNLLILSNGKNIAPTKIEDAICRSSWIDKVVLVGNSRTCVGAIVVPSFEKMQKMCETQNLSFNSDEEMVASPTFQDIIRGEIDRACEPFSPYEKVKRFYVSPRDFSFAMGELTPTQKVKRREVEKNFSAEVDKMFK